MKNLFTILFAICCLFTNATDIYVFTGASLPNYSSINTAVNNVASGDRILVASGTYNGNISIPASIDVTIAPMSPGDSYTIAGNVGVPNQSSNDPNRQITIIGANIMGNVSEEGNGGYNEHTLFSVIDCDVTGSFSTGTYMLTNLYYSTFNGLVDVMSLEIIGNYFNFDWANNTSNNNYLFLYSVNSSHNSISSQYSTNTTLKVFGNTFYNTRLRLQTSGGCYYELIQVANNCFTWPNSNNLPYDPMIQQSDGASPNTAFLIENNTFLRSSAGSTTGWLYYNSAQAVHTFRNNVVMAASQGGTVFGFGGNGIVTITHNLFNMDSWAVGSFPWFSSLPTGSSVDPNLNYFDQLISWNTTSIDPLSGICDPAAGLGTLDAGLDIIECRDIDNTQNDLGSSGGPHSWHNYHTIANGSGQIIDINIPFTIYGIPGVSLDIKGNAVHKNE